MTNVKEISEVIINNKSSNTLDYVECPIPYEEFFNNYLLCNKPCIFGSWVSQDFKARKNWVLDGKPNYKYLNDSFGDAIVPVANCSKQYFDSQEKQSLILRDYINYMQESEHNELLYLKDWHFVKEFPNYDPYITPCYFASDWLNEYLHDNTTDERDDYKFVYLGPKGSWTPFHSDVFRSYSWSINLCGKKKWIFYPPGQELYLKDKFGNLAYNLDDMPHKDFINSHMCDGRLEVVQREGEAIFVPSGWHHQVWNLEETMSINHNWINGTNIKIVWQFFTDSLIEFLLHQVEDSIMDCHEMDDWQSQVQLILKACHGMDVEAFFEFVCGVAKKRCTHLKDLSCTDLSQEQVLYDLQQLQWCLQQIQHLLDQKGLSVEPLPHKEDEKIVSLRSLISHIDELIN